MPLNKPILSVILPAYNAEKYIKEAIDSILNQTFADFELLICDDCSTDYSREIINTYKVDKRVKIIENKLNKGKNASVNSLLKLCKGKYLTIHDADDISHASRFERQISFLENNADYVLCGTSFFSFNEKGYYLSTEIMDSGYEYIKLKIQSKSCFHGPTILFKKEIIEPLGGLYRIMKMGEDIDFTMRVAERFKCDNISTPLYAYRICSSSVTKTLNYSLIDRQIDHELIYYLAEERKNSPSNHDSLMNKKYKVIHEKISCIKEKFYVNKNKHIQYRLGYLLSLGLHYNAIVSSFFYFVQNGFSYTLLREMIYVIRKSLITQCLNIFRLQPKKLPIYTYLND